MFDAELEADADYLIWPFLNNCKRDCFTIKNRDAHYCIPGNLSNDLLVDFSISEYRSHLDPESECFQKVHVFSVLLHEKMIQPDNNGKDCFGIYRSVHTWAQKIDFKEKEYLLFPISGRTHFYLIAYVHIMQALSGVSSQEIEQKHKAVPCILVFDSIKKKTVKYNEVIDNLNHFVLFEYMIQCFSMQDWCCGLVSKEVLLERMQSVVVCVVQCPQQPVYSLNCGMYCAKNAKFIHESLPIISKPILSTLHSKGFEHLSYNDEEVSSDRIQLSVRIRQLGIDYKEWKSLNAVSQGCKHEDNETKNNSFGSGGQRRVKIKNKSNSTALLSIDLISDDEVNDGRMYSDVTVPFIFCEKEQIHNTFVTSICPCPVDITEIKDSEITNKKKKSRLVEIDYNAIEFDTRPGAF